MADGNPTTTATDGFKSIMDADRRLLILRLLKASGPLGISPLCAAVAEFGHAAAAMTIVGDLAVLEQSGKVKLTENRMMVEAASSDNSSQVPKLTEDIPEDDRTSGHERDLDKGKGRETA